MAFDQDAFNTFVLDNNVIGFFQEPLTTKSGRQTHFYVNWRTVTEDAQRTDKLTDFILSYTTAPCFYGVPEGATKIGIVTQFKNAKENARTPLAMGRAQPKEHGEPKDKYFVGMPQGKTVVIEDTTTTGGSLLQELDKLKQAGVDVTAVLILTDRMERRDDGKTVKEMVEERGITYHALSTAPALLPLAFERLQPGETVGKAIEAYFTQYGSEELHLLASVHKVAKK